MSVRDELRRVLAAGAPSAPRLTIPPGFNAAEELRRAGAERMRRSLALFIQRGWHVLHPGGRLAWNWHLDAVAGEVQAMFEELVRARRDPDYRMAAHNLLINIPPRCSKSMIVSVYAPAWAWLRDPAMKIRCASSNPRVSDRDSRYCRQLIGSAWYRDTFTPAWEIRPDVDGVHLFANTALGERHASTFQARVTGEGTDVIIVDDPHDASDVMSEAKRSAVTDKWDNALANRVNDAQRCVRIGTMQRLEERDWSGHVLAQAALVRAAAAHVGDAAVGDWRHVCIPMEYEPEHPHRYAGDRRTEPGELLHPERFPASVLAAERVRLGSYGYAGQMQQRPAPDEGGMFKRAHWRFWKPDGTAADAAPRPRGCYAGPAVPRPARFDEIIISVDCTFGDTPTADRVAMLVIGRLGAQRFILDRRCARMDLLRTMDALRELAALYPHAHTKLVEKAANGAGVITALTKELPGLIAFPVAEYGPKESRANVAAPSVEAGNWLLPDGAPWLDDFIGEFAVFPNGANDDQVDALSQAAIRFLGNVAWGTMTKW